MLSLLFVAALSDDNVIFTYFNQDVASVERLCAGFPVRAIFDVKADGHEWKVDDEQQNDCDDSNTCIFSCSTAGEHHLTVTTDGGSSQATLVFGKCDELHWYAQTMYPNGTHRVMFNGSNIEVWPVSSAVLANDNEKNHTALEPSLQSQWLAHALNKSGNGPEVRLYDENGLEQSGIWTGDVYFDNVMGKWITTGFFNEWREMNAYVSTADGNNIADHRVSATYENVYPRLVNFTIMMQNEIINGKELDELNAEDLWTKFSSTMIKRHPCVRSTACIYCEDNSNTYLITTSDDFDSVQLWDIEGLLDIWLLHQEIIMMFTRNGKSEIIHIPYSNPGSVTSSELDIDAGNEYHIMGVDACVRLADGNDEIPAHHWVFMFSNTAGASSYLSLDGGNSFVVEYPHENNEAVEAAEFGVSGDGVIYEMFKRDNDYYLNILDVKGESLIKLREHHMGSSMPGLKCDDFGHIYLMNSSLFISTDDAVSFTEMQFSDDMDPDETIRDLGVSRKGTIVAVTSAGALHISRFDLNALYKIQPTISATMVCSFDVIERLQLLDFMSIAPAYGVPKYFVPLASEEEVIVTGHSNAECPIKQFDAVLPSDTHQYLDRNTKLVIPTNVVSAYELQPIIYTTKEVHTSITQKIDTIVDMDLVSNTFVSSKQIQSNITLSAGERGVSHVIITPSGSSIGCEDTVKVLRLFVGCPSGRHIRLKGGDRVRLFYTKTRYKPELELFDDDTYISDVEVDFAIYDESPGDADIRYYLTAVDAGCLHAPQTWSDFESPRDWNASSYSSCFTGPSSSVSSDISYPIMNSTSENFMIFKPDNKFYTMVAVILDPTFSYCSLTARFEIEVWGKPHGLHLLYSCLATAFSCGVIVFIFHWVNVYQFDKHRAI